MKKIRIYVEICVLSTCLLILWQFVTIIFHISNYYLPSSVDFFEYFIQFMQSGNMGLHITTTLCETFIGTFWDVILGMILGYLLVKNRLLEHLLIPLLPVVQTSPKISIVPLFILWFRLGLTPKIALVTLIVSFPIMVAEGSVLKKTNSGYRGLTNILQTSRWQIPICMGLPCAFREVISGSKVAVIQATTSAVIGKVMGARAGLGYLLTNGAEMYDLNMILSPIFLLSLLGLLLYEACQIVEHRVLYWKQQCLFDNVCTFFLRLSNKKKEIQND